MPRMLVEFIFLIAGALIGWVIAHVYYRRSKADLTALRSDIERGVAEGIVAAVRNAAGQIKGVKAVPNPPTDLKIIVG
jgi:hypothetical protein